MGLGSAISRQLSAVSCQYYEVADVKANFTGSRLTAHG